LHVSPVLACVAGGGFLQQRLSTAVSPTSRIQTRTIWELATFLLNALIFLLLGAQIGLLLGLVPGSASFVLRNGMLITLVAIGLRLVWVPLVTACRRASAEVRAREPKPRWRAVLLVSWTSMRGVVSLATALALPRTTASGAPFPYRTEIILVAVCVIVLTLFVQGLTLTPIVRALGFEPEGTHLAEERLARREATRRGAEALEDVSHEQWVDQRDLDALRAEVRDRASMTEEHRGSFEGRRRLRLTMINAERRMLVRLRNEDAISDDVLRVLEQELDLEAIRAGAGEER